MIYSEINATILAWVRRHGLTLYERYRDSEVRSVNLVDPRGRKFQIWIDPPTDGQVAIHVWDYKKRRKDWIADPATLDDRLEEASATVTEWELADT